MLTTLTTLAALALAQQTDTTVPVRAGARLEINNFGGEIAVKTWSRNAVRVVADHSSRDRITVDASDQVVRVKTEGGAAAVTDRLRRHRAGLDGLEPLRGLHRHQGGRRPERDHRRDGAGRDHVLAGRATCRSSPSWER